LGLEWNLRRYLFEILLKMLLITVALLWCLLITAIELVVVFACSSWSIKRRSVLKQLIYLAVKVLMMNYLFIMFSAELIELRVELFGIDDEGCSSKFGTPSLEDLLKLRQQIIHLSFENLYVFVEVDLDTICGQQQIKFHTLKFELLGCSRLETL
jgi:hypothetical protein